MAAVYYLFLFLWCFGRNCNAVTASAKLFFAVTATGAAAALRFVRFGVLVFWVRV